MLNEPRQVVVLPLLVPFSSLSNVNNPSEFDLLAVLVLDDLQRELDVELLRQLMSDLMLLQG
jgi:hypothetical protein